MGYRLAIARQIGNLLIVTILSILLPGWQTYPSAQAKDWIQIIENRATSHFREGITFRLVAEASGPDIEKITLFYRVRGDETLTQQPLEITPGSRVEAVYQWNLARENMTPFAPIEFYWEISDGVELKFTTETQAIIYEDTRFPWRILETESLSVRWYEGSEAFGEKVFNLAVSSLARMSEELKAELGFPVSIVLYATDQGFQSAFFFVPDWVGGRAYSNLGITLQIVPPNTAESWLRDVIPHEITHLYFYQATFNELAPTPAWLNEGLATYYELSDKSYEEGLVQDAANSGDLIPLRALAGGFGLDEEVVRLSYAESYSFVKFLFPEFGEEAMARLLAAYRAGHTTEEAFPLAFGASVGDLENQWRASHGAGPVPTPFTLLVPTFAVPTSTPRPSPTSQIVAEAPPSQTPTPSPLPEEEAEGADFTSILIIGGGLLGLVVLALVLAMRRRG